MDKQIQSFPDFIEDFEIKLDDADIRKRLAKVLCSEIEQSLKDNAATYELFTKCENQYRGLSKWKQAGQTKNKPWLDACDFWSPLTEWTICAIAARIDSILFSVEPMMTAFAVESSDVGKEGEITDFMDVVMTKIIQLRDKFKFYIKQKIKQPLAIASYEWEYQEEKIREVERGVVQEDFSIMLESGQITPAPELPNDVQAEIKEGKLLPGQTAYWYVERDKPIRNQPAFNYISPKDYVWSANTKKGQKPFLEGYQFWQTISQIRHKQQTEEYWDYEEIEDILGKTIQQKKAGSPDIANVLTERSYQFRCYKLFTRLPFDEEGKLDLDDSEATEQEVIAEIVYEEKVLLKLSKWHYLRYPDEERCFLHGFYEEKDALEDESPFTGRSISEKLLEINLLINKEFQQIVDNADLAMAKIFTKRRMLNDEDWEEPSVFPGAIWDVEEQGDIGVLEVGDVKRIGFEIMNQLMDFAVRVSNIAAINVGTREEGSKPLATEVVNIMKEAEVGRESFLQTCHEDLRKIYRWTCDYYFQFMPEGLEHRIRGDDKQLMFPEPPKKEQFINPQTKMLDLAAYQKAIDEFNKQKYYSREMLLGIGKWDFKWNGTQLSGDRQWQIQVSDYLAKVLPQFANYVSFSGVWELLRDILISRGKKDWQKYLVPKEMILPLDQQRQAKMQLLTQLPKIRQQMLAKGMDEQLVNATISKIQQQAMGGQPNAQPQLPDRKPPQRRVAKRQA